MQKTEPKKNKKEFKVKTQAVNFQKQDNIGHWLALLVMLVANLVLSLTLIPIIIVLDKAPLYGIIIIIGTMFGLLFELILEHLGELSSHHKIIARFFIPSIAILNIAIITALANKLSTLLLLEAGKTPAIVSLVYTIAFLSPFIYKDLKSRIIRK